MSPGLRQFHFCKHFPQKNTRQGDHVYQASYGRSVAHLCLGHLISGLEVPPGSLPLPSPPCLPMFWGCVVSLCCGSMSSPDLDENSRFFLSDSCLSHHTNCPFRARKLLTHSCHPCLFLAVAGKLSTLPGLGT